MNYFDASALAKRYMQEPGRDEVLRLLNDADPATSRLSEVEVASALIRRCREGAFSVEDRDRALLALRTDFSTLYVVELTSEIVRMTYELLAAHRLRAADSIQLASCLYFQRRLAQPVRFVVHDVRLAESAQALGLAVLN